MHLQGYRKYAEETANKETVKTKPNGRARALPFGCFLLFLF
jgi:hypothetical protein